MQLLITVFRLNYWKNSARFIFVLDDLTNWTEVDIKSYFQVFKACGILNAILIESKHVFNSDFFTKFYEIEDPVELESPFYQKSMKNYALRVVVGEQDSHMIKRGDKYISIDLATLDVIAEHEKFSVVQIELIRKKNWVLKTFGEYLSVPADLLAFTDVTLRMDPFSRSVNTYVENSYCALVQLPPRLTFLHFLLTPFDYFTWLLLVLSIGCCALIW